MTVSVAVNTAKNAQPPYNGVWFEPDIIMLADTRVTNAQTSGPLANEIVKVDLLSDHAIGGYSGNTIAAEQALSDIDDEFRELSKPELHVAFHIARRILSSNLNNARANSNMALIVLIGTKDFGSGVVELNE